MIEPYICDSSNQIYRFLVIKNFFLKGKSFRNILENCLEDNELISFMIVLSWHLNRLLFFEIKLL